MSANRSSSLVPLPLPPTVSSSYVDCTSSCGLKFHILSAGKDEGRKKPLILLTHGFPELAYSWRNVIAALAAEGYYVVAMDQRGYGRTTGWDTRPFHEVDISQFTYTNLVRDLVCLVHGLGYEKVHAIIGHDFGAVSSSMTALMRPDFFTATIQMSHPHHAPPAPPLGNAETTDSTPAPSSRSAQPDTKLEDSLAALTPPRKHYKWYNSTPTAAHDWDHPEQGLSDFFRGYLHLKSADWKHNNPHPLPSFDAEHLATMPGYYIMPAEKTMPETVAQMMKGEDPTATTRWLKDEELQVYVSEWSRTGFQGGLNWYRAQTSASPEQKADMLLFAGRKIEVPCAFISGARDWGNHQQPGALEKYEENCTDFRGVTLIEGAGHWVQQEQTEKVVEAVLKFLKGLKPSS